MSSGGVDQKLGQILIRQNILSAEEVARALAAQKEHELKTGERLKLGQILLFTKTLTLEKLQEALRHQTAKSNQIREKSKKSKEVWDSDRQVLEETYRSFIKPKESKSAGGDSLVTTFIKFLKRK